MVSTEREKPEMRENQSGSLVLKGKTIRWHLFSLALPTTVRNLRVLKNGLEILFLYQTTYFFFSQCAHCFFGLLCASRVRGKNSSLKFSTETVTPGKLGDCLQGLAGAGVRTRKPGLVMTNSSFT